MADRILVPDLDILTGASLTHQLVPVNSVVPDLWLDVTHTLTIGDAARIDLMDRGFLGGD